MNYVSKSCEHCAKSEDKCLLFRLINGAVTVGENHYNGDIESAKVAMYKSLEFFCNESEPEMDYERQQ